MNVTSRFPTTAFLTSSVFVLLTGFETASPEPQQGPAIVEADHGSIPFRSPNRCLDMLEYRTSGEPHVVNRVYEGDSTTREAVDTASHAALHPGSTF